MQKLNCNTNKVQKVKIKSHPLKIATCYMYLKNNQYECPKGTIFLLALIQEHCSVYTCKWFNVDSTCLLQLRLSSGKYVPRVIDIKWGRRANSRPTKPAWEKDCDTLGDAYPCRGFFLTEHISVFIAHTDGSHSKMKRRNGSACRAIGILKWRADRHGCSGVALFIVRY